MAIGVAGGVDLDLLPPHGHADDLTGCFPEPGEDEPSIKPAAAPPATASPPLGQAVSPGTPNGSSHPPSAIPTGRRAIPTFRPSTATPSRAGVPGAERTVSGSRHDRPTTAGVGAADGAAAGPDGERGVAR